MDRVAVFGIAGFTGRHFERFVAESGLGTKFEFHGFARNLTNARRSGRFVYRQGDGRNDQEVANFIKEVSPSYIVNFIGAFRASTFEDLIAVNVGVSHSICDAILRAKIVVKKIVLIGSAAEYGAQAPNPVLEDTAARPISMYGLSKFYQTLLADYFYRNNGLSVVVARVFNILGDGLSRDLSIGSFMHQIAEAPDKGVIKIGNIATSRDFLDISEVCRRTWVLLMKGKPGQIYNVCSGRPRSIHSVLEELVRASGKQIDFEVETTRLRHRDIDLIYGDTSKFDELER
jgi:GDP-4-dehydro-6-deoxy-D-mannose reductase